VEITEIVAIPDTYSGDETPCAGIFVGIRNADKHPGVLILDFVTDNGPLPMYVYGSLFANAENPDTAKAVLKSAALQRIKMTAGDLGEMFLITPGRRRKGNGEMGEWAVTAIERVEVEPAPTPKKTIAGVKVDVPAGTAKE